MFNLKAVVEALETLLFEVFTEENEIEMRPEALLNLINECSSTSCGDKLNKAIEDNSVGNIIKNYEEYQEMVRSGHLGKTGQFWISFMDNAKLVFLLTHAVKTNNRKVFHKCNAMMANLFFAFDGPNYSR